MHKATLLYNPLSGRRRERRVADIALAVQILRQSGIEIDAMATHGPGLAADQARQAIANGCDTILAGGGDGTIHDVLQGVVGTNAALGVIPLGTANALAHDLGVPCSPAGAARAAIASRARRIAAGKVEYQGFEGTRGSRYFTVGAGVGLDAHLFYALNFAAKERFGTAAYYLKAWELWLTHKLAYFAARYEDASGNARDAELTQLLAIRVAEFGGMLRQLAPGASLEREEFGLVLCKTHRRWPYLLYILRGLMGGGRAVRGIELAHSTKISCRYLGNAEGGPGAAQRKIYVEADGELLGTIPAEISMVPDAVNLLFPENARR